MRFPPRLLTPLLALIAVICGPVRAAEKPMNVVILYADDWRHDTLGCAGNPIVKTPNLDRLAAQGCRFTDAHATASVCTTTRFAFLTGRYAWRQPGTGIDRKSVV